MTPPRRYLFVTMEGGGNVPAVLGLVRRLAARGHVVCVLTEPSLRAAVEAGGARFRSFSRYFTREDRSQDLFRDWEAKTPIGALDLSLARVMLGPARIVAEEAAAAIADERPEVVVADVLMPAALSAAEAAGLPRVALFHMPEYLPGPGRPAAGPGFMPRADLLGRVRDGLMARIFVRVLGRHLAPFNDARRALGLAPFASGADLVDQYHQADLRLIQTCAAFDFPITPAPANVRYVGPVLDEPDWVGAWDDPWSGDDDRPLVVASLSTTFQNQREALQRVMAALGTLPVRGLVTLGPAMAGERFEVPANVRTAPSAPHGEVFPRAAAVVTHGGHGTVMRALSHGVPLLVLPMGRDQDDNGARVVASGTGLRRSPGAKPARIAEAVRALLAEPGFRERAGHMRRLILADAAEERGVAELEALAGRRATA